MHFYGGSMYFICFKMFQFKLDWRGWWGKSGTLLQAIGFLPLPAGRSNEPLKAKSFPAMAGKDFGSHFRSLKRGRKPMACRSLTSVPHTEGQILFDGFTRRGAKRQSSPCARIRSQTTFGIKLFTRRILRRHWCRRFGFGRGAGRAWGLAYLFHAGQ